jgi:hypothetical protein
MVLRFFTARKEALSGKREGLPLICFFSGIEKQVSSAICYSSRSRKSDEIFRVVLGL